MKGDKKIISLYNKINKLTHKQCRYREKILKIEDLQKKKGKR